MRLETSFAPPLGRWARPVAALLWVAAVALFVAAAALMVHRSRLLDELPGLAGEARHLHERRNGLDAAEVPTPEALGALRRRVARINALLAPAPPATLAGLRALEQALPRQVRLVSLRMEDAGQGVVLLAEAPPDAALPDLLRRLEASPAFTGVRLVQQQEVGSRQHRTVRAEIRADWPRG